MATKKLIEQYLHLSNSNPDIYIPLEIQNMANRLYREMYYRHGTELKKWKRRTVKLTLEINNFPSDAPRMDKALGKTGGRKV